MRSDNKALSVVQDALGLGAGKVDTAYIGHEKTIDTVNEIKDKLVAATGASADNKAKIQTEITALQAQLKMVADGATFSGSNWLSVNTTDAAPPRRRRRSSPRSSRPSTASSAGTISLDDRHHCPDVKLYEAYAGATAAERAFSTARVSAPPACATITATVAVAGTVAATDGYARLDADRRRLQRCPDRPDAERSSTPPPRS